ncbi:MAG: biotin--[acetyl-CoA-carboxylase] ligase [Clostridiales bacterium]|nr:biotin--[acetyl-CoA-carboxylase] ligase [Clostridiales bacterium]
MKTEILRCLRDTDGYVSGQELCDRLGVSRTAVWKVIRQLREEGYEIEAVRSRGYRMAESRDVLSESEIRSALRSRWAGQNLIFLDRVDSTNREIRRLADQGAPEGTLAVAEIQTAGKGRRGRTWNSPCGSGIWMSLLLRPKFLPKHASLLTLLAAMAVGRGIRETTGLDCKIKWPNDLVLGGKKLCGILTEMATEEDTICYCVVGIGINVNTEEFPEDIRQTATSLYLETGATVRRAPVINAVMCAWEEYYEKYQETLDMSLLIDEYSEHLINRNSQVRVLAPGHEYNGISRGINEAGELLVETEDGQIHTVLSGEVSVRGIYGYV